MREGNVIISEFEGMGFDNLDFQVIERWTKELYNFYPLFTKEALLLNTPMVANIMYTMMKPWLPSQVKDNVKLGCQVEGLEGRRLGELFQIPTPEIAQANLLEQLQGLLQQRFQHQTAYKLTSLYIHPGLQNTNIVAHDDEGVHVVNSGRAHAAAADGPQFQANHVR